MFNNFPKRTGIYHIKDGIENLELKVTFRHINSLLKLTKFDYNKNISIDWNEKGKSDDNEETDGSVCLKWQEKLFSASEKELYKESKNCISEIQRKYHKWLLENTEAGSEPTEIKSSSKRRRKKRTKKQEKSEQLTKMQENPTHTIHTYVHEDHFAPRDNEATNRNTLSDNAIHMYIYATIEVETELAHLKWYSQERMLHIYPDFNSFTLNPYYIEVDKDYRHLYAFAVENISKKRTTSPCGSLNLYLDLPELKPHWRTEEERASHFGMPPKRTKRISLLLELRRAYHFEYDNIHVRYHIHLPENTIHEEGPLEASTHSSSMSDSGIHHFGYNWQLTLLCEENYDASNLLHIYLEVISIDSWERERIEGYTFFSVNLLKASRMELYSLQCLRPVNSLRSAIERFFIGGHHKFDYVRFFGQQQSDSVDADGVDFHCRYGCRMQSTGVLEITCQSFIQKNCELLEPCENRRSGMTLDDIMMAYREARKRLEALTLK